jgi:uncharacterized protein YbjT (DUF2867 family)
VIYSSAVRAEQHELFKTWDPNGLRAGYWRAKSENQSQVMDAGFEVWTILQPAWLMANWIAPRSVWFWPTLATDRTMVSAFDPHKKVPLTAAADIAGFALRAFKEGADGQLANAIVPVAGDALTPAQMAEVMSAVTETNIAAKFMSSEEVEELKESNPMVMSQHWEAVEGPNTDLEQVKSSASR